MREKINYGIIGSKKLPAGFIICPLGSIIRWGGGKIQRANFPPPRYNFPIREAIICPLVKLCIRPSGKLAVPEGTPRSLSVQEALFEKTLVCNILLVRRARFPRARRKKTFALGFSRMKLPGHLRTAAFPRERPTFPRAGCIISRGKIMLP